VKRFLLALGLVVASISTAHAKDWTCHASFTPISWKMSDKNPFADREKQCKSAIISGWLSGQIWKNLSPTLTPAQQAALCGKFGTFRIDYGYDERKKEWNFTHSVPAPKCKCKWTCPADRWTEARPADPWACVKKFPGCKLPPGTKPWVQLGNGYFTSDQGDIHHEIPATKGDCVFE
jgi:hypothetical protein